MIWKQKGKDRKKQYLFLFKHGQVGQIYTTHLWRPHQQPIAYQGEGHRLSYDTM